MGNDAAQRTTIAYLAESYDRTVLLLIGPDTRNKVSGYIPNSDRFIENGQVFLDGIVRGLPKGAIVKVQGTDSNYAGSGRFGYVMTVLVEYKNLLEKLISESSRSK